MSFSFDIDDRIVKRWKKDKTQYIDAIPPKGADKTQNIESGKISANVREIDGICTFSRK